MKRNVLALSLTAAIGLSIWSIGTSFKPIEEAPPSVITVVNTSGCNWGIDITYSSSCGALGATALATQTAYPGTFTYTLPAGKVLRRISYRKWSPIPGVGWMAPASFIWNCNPGGIVQGTGSCYGLNPPTLKFVFVEDTYYGTIGIN